MEWTGLILAAALAAPLPKPPAAPDPLGKGFMGIYPVQDSCVVDRVEPGSPADRVGLRSGDEFKIVGTFTPRSFTELRIYVSDFRPGTRVILEIQRQNRVVKKIIQLGARTESQGYPFQIEVEP